ncbi:MAG: anti-sigma factor [Pseudomonadota bacterium]|uniref:anti-sigma factor family protein n=1 Tax=Marinobacter sp. TaxID=50741 RepID=UPI002E83FAD4|nr:anti-sigma factor [Pseudomonadota bacterium]
MTCTEIQSSLHGYLHKELSPAEARRVEQHLDGCPECRAALAAERSLDAALQNRYAVPAPSENFQARVLSAAHGDPRGRSASWRSPEVGGAIAAALVFGLGLGLFFGSGIQQTSNPVATTAPAQVEAVAAPVEKTVRLAFRSAEALENVTLTLELPPNVEVAAWPGRRELSWQVSLDKGENVLALPLKLLFPGNGELVARLDAGDRQKTFRAPIPRYPEPYPEDSGS